MKMIIVHVVTANLRESKIRPVDERIINIEH
jgi:hypothetical protein